MVIVEQTTKYSDKIAMRIVVFSRLDKLAICSFESVFDEAAMHALLGSAATAARGTGAIRRSHAFPPVAGISPLFRVARRETGRIISQHECANPIEWMDEL